MTRELIAQIANASNPRFVMQQKTRGDQLQILSSRVPLLQIAQYPTIIGEDDL